MALFKPDFIDTNLHEWSYWLIVAAFICLLAYSYQIGSRQNKIKNQKKQIDLDARYMSLGYLLLGSSYARLILSMIIFGLIVLEVFDDATGSAGYKATFIIITVTMAIAIAIYTARQLGKR